MWGKFKYPLHCALWLDSVHLDDTMMHCYTCHGNNGKSTHTEGYRKALSGTYETATLIVCCVVNRICTKAEV